MYSVPEGLLCIKNIKIISQICNYMCLILYLSRYLFIDHYILSFPVYLNMKKIFFISV